MKSSIIAALAILALMGAFFLGKGITSLVVSQSCCFGTGASCAAEDLCDAAKPAVESPLQIYQSEASIYFGAMLILVSALVYLIMHCEHHRKH